MASTYRRGIKCEIKEDLSDENDNHETDLEDNDLEEEPAPEHFCDYCNKPFHKLNNLRQHVKMTHEKTEYRCPYCEEEKIFSQDKHLKQHVKKAHAGMKCFKCEKCSKGFMNLWK